MSAGITPPVGGDIVGRFPPVPNPLTQNSLIYWDGTLKTYVDVAIGAGLVVSGGVISAPGPSGGPFVPYTSATADLNMGAHSVIANGVTVGIGTAAGGATYGGLSINAGGNTDQANVNLNDSAGNVQFSFGNSPANQFYLSDGVAYQFFTVDHGTGSVQFNCLGQFGEGSFAISAQEVDIDIGSSYGGLSCYGGSYTSLLWIAPAQGTNGYATCNIGDWGNDLGGTSIILDDGALTIKMNASFGIYANNYLIDASLTGGILSGIFPDSPGLPIADWIFNCLQLQNYGLTCDSTQPGGLMRLDMRGVYPFFQLLYQPPGSNSTNDQQGPFQITSTSYVGVMPSVLVGWPGAGVDNTGTGNGENLQVYGATHIGGTLAVVGFSTFSSDVQAAAFTTDGSHYWALGALSNTGVVVNINGTACSLVTSNNSGSTTLVSGTKAVTVTGITTSNKAFVQLTAPAGTLGNGYKAVCTTNTLTITSETAAGATQTLDTSTLNYIII